MRNQKKPKVGQAVTFKGAVATVLKVGPKRMEDGQRLLCLDTHVGHRMAWTDHPKLHIP